MDISRSGLLEAWSAAVNEDDEWKRWALDMTCAGTPTSLDITARTESAILMNHWLGRCSCTCEFLQKDHYSYIVSCSNRRDHCRWKQQPSNVCFFRIPKVIWKPVQAHTKMLSAKHRRTWLACIKRANFDDENSSVRLCKEHFVTSNLKREGEILRPEFATWCCCL